MLNEGEKIDFVPISPPIYQTTTFEYKDFNDYIDRAGNNTGYSYTRASNPTIELLESKIAKLENAENSIIFSSGMGAISSTLLSLLKSGEDILSINTIYGENIGFMDSLNKYDMGHKNISATSFKGIKNHVTEKTKIVYIESPSSQKMELCDLEDIAFNCKKLGIITIIDNTWASPLFQKPLNFGVDISIHSLSKYIGGASDLIGGAVLGDNRYLDIIREFGSHTLGNVISPMEAWLFMRSLKSLEIRMKQHNSSIRAVIDFLSNKKEIRKIYHPLQATCDVQKKLGEKYLLGFGSLFSFELNTNDISVMQKFVDGLKKFKIAVSWGGAESLVLPAYKGNNLESMTKRGLKISHIRLYIGLEDTEVLINDLKRALTEAFHE